MFFSRLEVLRLRAVSASLAAISALLSGCLGGVVKDGITVRSDASSRTGDPDPGELRLSSPEGESVSLQAAGMSLAHDGLVIS